MSSEQKIESSSICLLHRKLVLILSGIYPVIYFLFVRHFSVIRYPLWSNGQSFWLQIQRSRVRFPALPDFLSSSGSGTGSTQPREVN